MKTFAFDAIAKETHPSISFACSFRNSNLTANLFTVKPLCSLRIKLTMSINLLMFSILLSRSEL
uniref:Uncharacterized protein n=1 Tax=Arundo donax TaxID=35708 RepID=A0A0A9BMI0_ARUDO